MKPLPTDPMARQARMMAALLGDILDPNEKDFARLDALREVSIQSNRGTVRANNAPVENNGD